MFKCKVFKPIFTFRFYFHKHKTITYRCRNRIGKGFIRITITRKQNCSIFRLLNSV